MIRTAWTKPYVRVKQDGVMRNSFVAFDKQASSIVNIGDGPIKMAAVSQFRYRLYFDLWVVKLDISWLGGEKSYS